MTRWNSQRSWCLRPLTVPLLAIALVDGSASATARSSAEQGERRQELVGRALLAVVSLTRQRISLYDGDGNMIRAPISSGQDGYETPTGVFSVLQKEEEHHSNLYDDASMPFMQRITWSGVALHAGELPGYPASHGCVRLDYGFAERIFPQTRLGMRVVISTDDVAPAPISHALLPQPQPLAETPPQVRPARDEDEDDEVSRLPDVRAWPARYQLQQALQKEAATAARIAEDAKDKAEGPRELVKEKTDGYARAKRSLTQASAAKLRAEKQLAGAEGQLAAASRESALRSAQATASAAETALKRAVEKIEAATAAEKQAADELARATEAARSVEAEEAAAVAVSRQAKRKMRPVSIFVDLSGQRLYVRQINEHVVDVPITVRDPQLPGGTHVFTAVGYGEDGNRARWNVVSLTHRHGEASPGSDDQPRRRKSRREDAALPTDTAASAAVLERIDIPAEIRERFFRYVWPGSSLIISDEELSKETGPATDFVVVMRDAPQGALKTRPRQETRSYADDDGDADERYRRSRRYFRTYRAPGPSPYNWW